MNNALKIVKAFQAYQKQDWMIGQEGIESLQQDLQHLQKLCAAIEHFERKAATAYEDLQDPGVLGWSYHYHKYQICQACATRLRKRFNIEVMEIQL